MKSLKILKELISVVMLLLVALTCLSGCKGYSMTGGPAKASPTSLAASGERSRDLLSVNSLLVSKIELDPEAQIEGTGRVNFDQELERAIKEQLDLKVFFPSEAGAAKSDPKTWAQSHLKQAKSRDIDGVLFTRVHKFVQRKGTAVSSEQGATVDFTMKIVRASDGNEVWTSNYHYKDQALSENLFRIKERLTDGKSGWQSAEDLLSAGYRSALNDFAAKRLQQFSKRAGS